MLVLVMLISSLAIASQSITIQAAAIAFTCLILIVKNRSRQSIVRILHRIKRIFRVIVAIFIAQVLLRRGGEPLFQWHLLLITETGLTYAAVTSMRLFLIVLVAGLLFDYPFTDYLRAFRAWKIPYEISFLIASTIHFIPMFRRQITVIREALQVRGIRLGDIPVLKRGKAISCLVVPIVAGVLNDVKYRSISLEMRGFRYRKMRTDFMLERLTMWDYLVQVVGILLFSLVLLFSLTHSISLIQ